MVAPSARKVQLVADFTQWEEKPVELEKGADGLWSATVKVEPGEHRYRFLVDGEWSDDPGCADVVPNPFGSNDAVRQVK